MAHNEKAGRFQKERKMDEPRSLLPMLIGGLALIVIGMIGVVIFV